MTMKWSWPVEWCHFRSHDITSYYVASLVDVLEVTTFLNFFTCRELLYHNRSLTVLVTHGTTSIHSSSRLRGPQRPQQQQQQQQQQRPKQQQVARKEKMQQHWKKGTKNHKYISTYTHRYIQEGMMMQGWKEKERSMQWPHKKYNLR